MKIKFHFLFFLFCLNLNAAAPLTHLYLADIWCEQNQVSSSDRKIILRGSLFPDIRYIAHIPRELTHKKNVCYEDILSSNNAFETGCLLHCFVDEKREYFVQKHGLYPILKKLSHNKDALFLKLIEDEILFEKCKTKFYQDILFYLSDEELTCGIKEELVETWNQFIFLYLSQSPACLLKKLSQEKFNIWGVSPKILKDWSTILPQLKNEPKIQCYFEEMLEYFQTTFKKAPHAF